MSRMFETEYFFKATQERVWKALTTPELMAEWMGSPIKVLELRPGGKLEVEGLHPGEIVVVDAPNKLAWSWDPENGTEPGEEIIALRPAEGGTIVSIQSVMHGRWASDLMYFGGSEAGWLDWLDALNRLLDTGKGGMHWGNGTIGAAFAAEEMGEAHRMYIKKVVEDGPAHKAGLKVGDTLRSLNGQLMNRTSAFWRIAWRFQPGAKAKVEVERDGQTIHTEVLLAAPKSN